MHSPKLDERDAAAVLGLVETLTTAQTIDEYAVIAMTGLSELIPCIDSSFNEMNPSAQRIRWRAIPENSLMDDYAPLFAELMLQNPLVRHFNETEDTRAMMWSDLATLDQIHATELHQEMFRPLGVDSQMALVLPAPPGIIVGFAVNTGAEGFSERDRSVMNTLRPHLAHYYRVIQLRDELSSLQRALRTRGWTGALANGDGIVEAVSDDARQLEDQSGVTVAEGEPLPEPLRASFAAGVRAYEPSRPAVLSRSTRISEEANGVAGWHVPGPIAPHVVIVQTDVDASVQRLHAAGLSPRQLEVALQLAEGGTNRAIANRLGMAEGTVRKHLERIYRLLDVSDRASAIAQIRGW
ncbi:MAG: LuxR C-terminal-related transcriptional regulator [Acidimicrobiia bacterium]|nr:LuxR C-terminal-related transcriptional regulator [Acidimicrobiia bacterium]